MRRLRAAALSEVELAMDIINQAKAHLRAQGIDQWQTGYPDRDCLERDVRTGKGYFLEEDGIPLGYLCVDFDGEPARSRSQNMTARSAAKCHLTICRLRLPLPLLMRHSRQQAPKNSSQHLPASLWT